MTSKALAAIWVVFAIIFCCLAAYHFQATNSVIPDFVVPERPFGRNATVNILGAPTDAPLKEFAKAVNEYTHAQNESSQQQNWISFFGYVVAALTAFFSAVIELFPRENRDA